MTLDSHHTSDTHHTHIIYMSYANLLHTIYISYTYHLHIIYISYTYHLIFRYNHTNQVQNITQIITQSPYISYTYHHAHNIIHIKYISFTYHHTYIPLPISLVELWMPLPQNAAHMYSKKKSLSLLTWGTWTNLPEGIVSGSI